MRQGTSRVIVIACYENFFQFLSFEAVFPEFGIFWHVIHFTHLQFSLCNSFWCRFSMPITNPRGRQNVKIIRITNHRTGNCFWWEKIEQMLWISSKCYLFKGKCYPKDIFCHFGGISFIKNCYYMLYSYFLSQILLSKPFGWLLTTRTVFRTN